MTENTAVAGPSQRHVPEDPAWLLILLQDSLREADDALVMGPIMVGEKGRAIVWTMSASFGCNEIGVPGQTCRVFERYLANLTRFRFHGNNQHDLWNYLTPRLMVILACCFQIATKATSSATLVCPKAIRAYLTSCGIEHTIGEIMTTEREIFRGIGYSVPLYNSVEMAELLADHLNVERKALELVVLFVNLAEKRRHNIEDEVRFVAGLHRIPYSNPRVRTLHLAAGCVAAAVKKAGLVASNNTENQLARMIRVSSSYIKVLRDVIFDWVTSPRIQTPEPKHIPNILRRRRFAGDAGHREPQPSSSKSMKM